MSKERIAALLFIVYAEEIATPKYSGAVLMLCGYLYSKGYLDKEGRPTKKSYKLVAEYSLDIPQIQQSEEYENWLASRAKKKKELSDD